MATSSPAPVSRSDLAGRALPSQVVRVFGDLSFRIDGELLALTHASDGSVWSVEEPGMLRHWDGASGQQLAEFPLSDLEMVWTFRPDAQLVASGSDDLSLWDTGDGGLVSSIPQPSWVTAQAFGGQLLATGHDDGRVRLWELSPLRLLRELDGQDRPISALAFSPDGGKLASAAEDRIIALWDTVGGRLLGRLKGHSDRVQALAWHPEGRLVVSGGWDTTARVWDSTTLEPVIILNGHADLITALSYSPDGKLLACADSDRVIWIWDAVEGKPLWLLRGHAGQINCLAFRPDSQGLLTGGEDRRLQLWDVPSGRNLTSTDDQEAQTVRICLSPDGKRLTRITGTTVQTWDTESGATAFTIDHPHPACVVRCSPDGSWLVTGDLAGAIHFWNAEDGQWAKSLEGHRTAITDLAFSPDGQTLAFSPDGQTLASAGGQDGYVYLWSLLDFEPQLLIPEATGEVGTAETVGFVPGTGLLAIGGVDWSARGEEDGCVAIWDVVNRREVGALAGGTTRLAVRPDGKQLAAVTQSDSICLWDLTTQTLVRELVGHEATITCLAYSPDGRLVVTGSEDGTLRFWPSDPSAAETVLDLGTPIKDLAFSPDGRRLYTANANTTCYMIDLAKV